jgi:hypothetical protein
LSASAKDDRTLNCGEFEALRIVGIVRVDLCGEDTAITDQPCHFDMKSSAGGGYTQDARAERASFSMSSKRLLDGVDAVRQGQE